MADIILINDQGQEQTLTGVEKLVTRGTDKDKVFVFDPSGGAAVGYKQTEYTIAGTIIAGAAEAKDKMMVFTNPFVGFGQVLAYSYVVVKIEPMKSQGQGNYVATPRGLCVRLPRSASPQNPDYNNVDYPNLDALFDWQQSLDIPGRFSIAAYIKGHDLILRSIKQIDSLGGATSEMEYCDPDTYNITGKLVVVEKIETES